MDMCIACRCCFNSIAVEDGGRRELVEREDIWYKLGESWRERTYDISWPSQCRNMTYYHCNIRRSLVTDFSWHRGPGSRLVLRGDFENIVVGGLDWWWHIVTGREIFMYSPFKQWMNERSLHSCCHLVFRSGRCYQVGDCTGYADERD